MTIYVYSANVGEHDPPREDDEIEFIGNYNIKMFTKDLLGDPLLSARFYKTCPEMFLPMEPDDWSLWIDANVWLNVKPDTLVDKVVLENYPGDCTFGVFQHTHRNNVIEEAEAVLSGGFDTPERVRSTMDRNYQNGIDMNNLAMTMVLLRKATQENRIRNLKWWAEICAGSRRDQLSFGRFYPGRYWNTVDFTKPNRYFTRVD
jgi:hypothetical protein